MEIALISGNFDHLFSITKGARYIAVREFYNVIKEGARKTRYAIYWSHEYRLLRDNQSNKL